MYRMQTAASLIAALIAVTAVTGPTFAAATLDRIRQSGKIALGYQADAQPFSYRDDSGNPSGYSVALCQAVADGLKANLGLANLSIEWVPVTVEERFSAVQQGKVDLLCGAETETLARRKDVSFSLPIYPSGIGALLAPDASSELQEILERGSPPTKPIWRGSPRGPCSSNRALLSSTRPERSIGCTNVRTLSMSTPRSFRSTAMRRVFNG